MQYIFVIIMTKEDNKKKNKTKKNKKKKTILIMSVGTGLGSNKEKRIKSLAHGLFHAIDHYKPDFILFFGSEKSKETVEEVKIFYKEENGTDLAEHKDYKFYEIKEIDDISSCIEFMRQNIEPYSNEKLYFDYTSGTKSMTTSTAILSIIFRGKLMLVAGKRGKDGIVESGTEQIKEQNLYYLFNNIEILRLRTLVNSNQFKAAKQILSNLTAFDEEIEEIYENWIQFLDEWDCFNHIEAKNIIKEVKIEDLKKINVDITEKRLNKIKKHLGLLVSKKQSKESIEKPTNEAVEAKSKKIKDVKKMLKDYYQYVD